MKKYLKLFLIVLSMFLITACSNSKNETEFDVYVNDNGYNLEDELYIEISLKTEDKDVTVCPVLKIYKDDEKDISNISKSINFSTDYVEFINLFGLDFSEKLNQDHLSFETILSNEGEEIDLTNETIIERVKITLKEKGNYTISLEENTTNEQCKIYNEALNINITKNEE